MVSLYFSDRKEYYRRRGTTVSEVRKEIKEEKIIYFINFDFGVGDFGGSSIYGSLSSPIKISLEAGISIIKANVPHGWMPVNFYEAEEEGIQKETLLIIMRDDEDIINEVIHV